MSEGEQPKHDKVPLEIQQQIDRLVVEFESAWNVGEVPRTEDYLNRLDDLGKLQLLERLLALEFELLQQTTASTTAVFAWHSFIQDAAVVFEPHDGCCRRVL